jgi:hypothetical protein
MYALFFVCDCTKCMCWKWDRLYACSCVHIHTSQHANKFLHHVHEYGYAYVYTNMHICREKRERKRPVNAQESRGATSDPDAASNHADEVPLSSAGKRERYGCSLLVMYACMYVYVCWVSMKRCMHACTHTHTHTHT